jgi:hypothetical protein
MPNLLVNPPQLFFVISTRAALAFGAGLLLSRKIPESARTKIGAGLVALGAATTIPALMSLRRSRQRETQPPSAS